jgi:hypothetical protein
MSDSNRGKRTKTELAVFAGIAVTFITSLLFWAIPEHLAYSNQAAFNTEYHQRWADNRKRRDCVRAPAIGSRRCVEEAQATSEERQRAERDIEAQRKMALWTAIMGAMAVIGVGLSGFGVYLIWRTWDATREAADNSRLTLRSFIAKERAHLRIRKAVYSFEGDEDRIGVNNQGFRLALDNKGESACTVLEIGWQYSPMRHWLPKMEQTLFKPVLIPAQSEELSPHLGISEIPNSPCWLMGRATYQTLENETFTSYFSLKIELHIDPGCNPSEWRAVDDRMIAMPHDT